MNAAQLGANGSVGGEHEASCRMMLMLLSLKPIIASTHFGAGKFFIQLIGCVSQGWAILMIMGSKDEYPYLLVPSIEDRGGAAFLLRGIEDDEDEAEASLLSVAPKLPKSPVAG